jgi:hypothetical protein
VSLKMIVYVVSMQIVLLTEQNVCLAQNSLPIHFKCQLLTLVRTQLHEVSKENKGCFKSSVFWDRTSCSPLKATRRFGTAYGVHVQGRRIRKRYHRESRWQCLFFDPKVRCYVALKRRLTVNGLHGVISQKIVLFITTAVRKLNPTGAAYSEDHTKHRKHSCGNNIEISKIIEDGTYIKFTLPPRSPRFDNRSCIICGGQSGTGTDFTLVFLFPLPILISLTAPHSIPINVRSTNAI